MKVPVNPIIEFILKTIFRFILKNCVPFNPLIGFILKKCFIIIIFEVVEVEASGYLKRH